ncbi:uncharacterized protein DUF1707 [Streptomyces puniciscabiei]|uniref:Uncharacterized protein DUF1707 n=1 Tax=Streptomyces puniciscabiei TaxID=164348 RepID=A0A542UH89_9ACTN|nr:DUF1707 domain-containing protein [Streptomyces puniciscabiei]TQK98432.1 uncharacterized protein DUF1707 [Streptomyces puniciscabiei]
MTEAASRHGRDAVRISRRTSLRSQKLRIGHDARERAIEALTEHSREGRLSIDEYGDRLAAAQEAVSREDLSALFTDLPEPHLHRPEPAAPAATSPHRPTVRERLTRASVPVGAVAAVGLTTATGNWLFMFLTPPVTYAVESLLRGARSRRHG